MNTYKLSHQANCPKGELVDCYEITIQSHATILVEDIIETIGKAPTTLFQEDLATYLRSKIGAFITITGWHHGIQITCERP